MELELLQKNILAEKTLVSNLIALTSQLKKSQEKNRKEIDNKIKLGIEQIKMINSAIPGLLESIQFFKPLGIADEKKDKKNPVVNIKSKPDVDVVVKKEHETKFIKNLKDSSEEKGNSTTNYVKFSNRIFKNTSANLAKKDFFINIKSDLRKIGSPMLVSSYLSVMLMTTLLVFIFSLIVAVSLVFLKLNYLYSLLLVILAPLLVFILFYLYPSSNVKSLEKSINQELPFMTIFMSAIATSGIEPSKIFSILISSRDYPATSREIKKLINYINFYGYDLVSALRIVSKSCPSERLALLLDGMATSITSGGELSTFLNKHAETLLFDYRLEREKYTQLAETFMNIYISVVIAAPMILMILLILMSLTGFGGANLSSGMLTFIIIFGIGLLNVGFLLFLNMKQPKF